jgi:hypothetical protein
MGEKNRDREYYFDTGILGENLILSGLSSGAGQAIST